MLYRVKVIRLSFRFHNTSPFGLRARTIVKVMRPIRGQALVSLAYDLSGRAIMRPGHAIVIGT